MSTTAQDPNFFRSDTPVFGSLRLTDTSNQLQTARNNFTLPSANGTLKAAGAGQPVTTLAQSTTVAATIDPTLGDVFVLNADGSLNSGTWEINLASVPAAGQRLTFVCNAVASNGTVIFDFDTNFRAGAASEVSVLQATTKVVEFLSDGTNALLVGGTPISLT